jgi:hypothetical protein
MASGAWTLKAKSHYRSVRLHKSLENSAFAAGRDEREIGT